MSATLDEVALQVENLRLKESEAQAARRSRLREVAFVVARGESTEDVHAMTAEEVAWVHAEAARIVKVGPALSAYLTLPDKQKREDEARELARARLAELDAEMKRLQTERGSVGQNVNALARERETCALRAEPLFGLLTEDERGYAQQQRRALDAARARAHAAQSQIDGRGGLIERAKATIAHWASVVTRYQASNTDEARMRSSADRQSAAARAEVERLENLPVGKLREEVKAAEAEALRLEADLVQHFEELRSRYLEPTKAN